MKNPLTSAGIEPETFRFVAQHLNHCATAVVCIGIYLKSLMRFTFLILDTCYVDMSKDVGDLWLFFEVKRFGKNGLQNLTKQILAGHDRILENNIYTEMCIV